MTLHRRGSLFYWRIGVLLLFLGGAVFLYLLSQADDPRFHYFLSTRAGHVLAQAFGWHRGLGPGLPADRPERNWSPEQRVLKYRWERELIEEAPLHRLRLTDGSALDGRLVSETSRDVVFQEAVGEGGLAQRYARDRVVRVETLARPAHAVSYRDILFRQSLPEFHFLKRAPYTVATDGPEDEIREALSALRARHRELAAFFADLVQRPPVRTDLPVVFCSRERVFRSFRERFAPDTLHVTGFYVPWVDCLYLLNFDSSDAQHDLMERVLSLETRHHQAQAGRPADADTRAAWRDRTMQRIHLAAQRETLATIRHEGAHQFLYDTGVHSDYRAENEWLVEGLATWCETAEIGQPQPVRLAVLAEARARGGCPSLARLVNARRFQSLGERDDVLYALSWLLTDWLMQPTQREAFFRYIRWQRDPAHLREVSTCPAWDVLTRETGYPASVVEQGVQRRIDELAPLLRTSLPGNR